MKDVGKSKAEVAAERIMSRIKGVKVTPHHARIEDFPPEFYRDFSVIVLGLDSLEARRHMNTVVCTFLGEERLPAPPLHSPRSLTSPHRPKAPSSFAPILCSWA